MRIATVKIATKKDHTETTQWEIHQDRPYPDITSCGSMLEWRNGDGLLPCGGNPFKGIDNRYTATLLRPGFTLDTSTGDRNDYAGFKGNLSPRYRGKPLGEIWAEIDCHSGRVFFRVSYFETLTPSARAMLHAQVAPSLLAYVDKHKAALRKDAKSGIKKGMQAHLASVKKDLIRLAEEMRVALATT